MPWLFLSTAQINMEGKMLVSWVDICQLSTLRIVKDAEIHNRFIESKYGRAIPRSLDS
jgi:hypothetical protein